MARFHLGETGSLTLHQDQNIMKLAWWKVPFRNTNKQKINDKNQIKPDQYIPFIKKNPANLFFFGKVYQKMKNW